jgi:hypothetical protein
MFSSKVDMFNNTTIFQNVLILSGQGVKIRIYQDKVKKSGKSGRV